MSVAIVIPTVGRPSLARLLARLAASAGPRPQQIVLVDDRRSPTEPLDTGPHGWLRDIVEVRRSGGRGPAAARNVGWRATTAEWVAFLDDDVEVGSGWLDDLAGDLDQPADVAGSQGRLSVPLPAHRRPTDWERGTAGLQTARWITADMAYRRDSLVAARGFDERFPRAYREDSDLALRVCATGRRIVTGSRLTVHPVRPASWTASVRQQRGNSDDALMRAVHGRDWYDRAGASRGVRNRHAATTAALAAAITGAALGRRSVRTAGAVGWAAATAAFAAERIRPGPRDVREVATMLATSLVIPPLATYHRLRGTVQHATAKPWHEIAPAPVAAVLFDRDGTIIRDVPYNGDPSLVETMPGAAAAIGALRRAGVRVGVVSNQSGIGRGLLTTDQVQAVNARVEKLLGPMDTWQVCPHDSNAGCQCRKPRSGLVDAASVALGVDPAECVVIGDTGADVAAAESAGARGLLVPNAATRPQEVAAARWVRQSIVDAVDAVLTGQL